MPTSRPAVSGPQTTDSAGWRVIFAILQGKNGEWRRAVVFVVLILGTLVALAVIAGPWVLSAFTGFGALTAGGTAVARKCAGRKVEKPQVTGVDEAPDTAVKMGPTLAA